MLRNLGLAFNRLSLHTVRVQGVACTAAHTRGLSQWITAGCAPHLTPTAWPPQPQAALSCHTTPIFHPLVRGLKTSDACQATLNQMHRSGPVKKKRKNKNPLINKPFAKGVVLKTLILKPKKPNSANRKCVLVRLTNGKEMKAYVPGEGHNLQEHNIVMVRPGRLQDTPGVKLKCVRGKYDLAHVMKKRR